MRVLSDARASDDRAPVEADHLTVLGEHRREGISVGGVPSRQEGLVERGDLFGVVDRHAATLPLVRGQSSRGHRIEPHPVPGSPSPRSLSP
jgi:hypothetical protein